MAGDLGTDVKVALGSETLALPAPRDGDELVVSNPGNLQPGIPALERNAAIQLRRLANALDRVAERLEALGTKVGEALTQTRTAMSDLLTRFDTLQMANLRAPADSTVPHFYAFSVPIAWSGHNDEAALRVYYRPGRSRRVDPSNTHLAFRLTLAPLGTVRSTCGCSAASSPATCAPRARS